MEKISERTLYQPIGRILEDVNLKNIQEIRSGNGYMDLECFFDHSRVVIEVKIEDPHTKWKNLLQGVAQAWQYSKSTNAKGFIVIEYPSTVRRPLAITPEVVEQLATESYVNAVVLSDFWSDRLIKIKPPDLLEQFKEKADAFITKKEKYVSLNFAVETIRDSISTISEVLRKFAGTNCDLDNLINTVVGRFDLFLALAGKDRNELKLAAIDLSSYLLVNQILFYHIYASLTEKIPDFDEDKINSIQDLRDHFKNITDINYKAVYSVDIISNIPDNEVIVKNVKDIIRATKGVRAASIKHDLIGRIYHESLPYETRKRLATFYTKPVAAEILAGLCIDKWDEKVTDLACGSGTLLVASYRRKENLYKEEKEKESLSISEIEKLHNAFAQEELTGLDIMPFATHLTAVNLSSQTPHITTNRLRVAVQDSLLLQNSIKSKEFKEKGVLLKSFSRTIQETFTKPEKIIKQTYFSGDGKFIEVKGAVSPEGSGEPFLLHPTDVVIMNPPFSDRVKMPADYREKLKTLDKLANKCGNQVNLWGYFLALADDIVKEDGKIGAVIPINIARGRATEKIRNYLLENYHIKYIVKTTKDLAFSEAAAFRDILVVAEKRQPNDDDLTGIILFKKSLNDYQILKNTEGIIEEIRTSYGQDVSNEVYEVFWLSYSKIKQYKDNLMALLGLKETKEILIQFIEFNRKIAGTKLLKIEKGKFIEGFHTSPAGRSELTFVTRPTEDSRVKRAFLILKNESEESITINVKGTDITFKIDKALVHPALRTVTAINTLDITKKHDYSILGEFDGFKTLLTLSKWKKRSLNWANVREEISKKESYLAISLRFNPHSPNTCLIAFASEKKFIASDSLKVLKGADQNIAMALCIFLNSVVFIAQILSNKEETTGEYIHIRETDLILCDILDINKLSSKDTQKLLSVFQKIKNVEFPSIIEQFETKFEPRIEIDKVILKILGLSDMEIDEWLPKIYNAVVGELKTMKEFKNTD